jgi:hypothetical protein
VRTLIALIFVVVMALGIFCWVRARNRTVKGG